MKKILIIDDENDVRELIYDLLEDHIETDEVELYETGTFETAVELIDQYFFDLIITDLCLSGTGGLDILKFVRQTAQNKISKTGIEIAQIASDKYQGRTKLVAITGLADLIEYRENFTMFNQILEKPFTPDFPQMMMDLLEKP